MSICKMSPTAVARPMIRGVSRLLIAVIALIGIDFATSVRPAHAVDPGWVAGGVIGTIGGIMMMEMARQAEAQARAQARARQQAARKSKERKAASKPKQAPQTSAAASAQPNHSQTEVPITASSAPPPSLVVTPAPRITVQSPPQENSATATGSTPGKITSTSDPTF